jgi:hypothetical protein
VLQSSNDAIERVAQFTDLRDPEQVRRAFISAPSALRRAARAG